MPWELKFHNAEGGHWKFEAPNQDIAMAAAHNQHYLPDEFYQEEEDAYFENDALSGKFKIYAGRGEGKEAFIKDTVRAEMIKQPKPVLVAETEKTAQISMNQLIDKLEHLLQEQKITEKQQKKIFEQYFDKFQAALGQKPSTASKRAVDKIVEEINQLGREENKENEPPAKKRRKI